MHSILKRHNIENRIENFFNRLSSNTALEDSIKNAEVQSGSSGFYTGNCSIPYAVLRDVILEIEGDLPNSIYRVVQLNFTPEVKVFYRSLSIFRIASLKQHKEY